MIDTKHLRTLAEAATPGPWMRLFGERTVYDRMEDGCRGIAIVRSDYSPPTQKEAANIDYIAACSPDVVLALLDALERKDRVLREALEAIEIAKNGLDWFKDSYHTTLTKAMLKRQNRSTRLSKPSPRNWHHEKEKPIAHSVCCCRTSSYVVYLVLGWRISTRIRENVVSLNPSERNATFQLKRALKAEDECRALLDALERKDAAIKKCYSEVIRGLADVVNVHTPDKLFDLDAIPRDPVMAIVSRIKTSMEAITKEIGA